MGAIRELADRYTEATWVLDPCGATFSGALGHDDALTDHSPEGEDARAALARATLRDLDAAAAALPGDEGDRRCRVLLRERLDAAISLSESDEALRSLNNIGSPAQELREVFDVTPADTPEAREALAARLAAAPEAWSQYRRALEAGMVKGVFAAPRQVQTAAEQLAVWSGQREPPAYFDELVRTLPEAEQARFAPLATAATAAMAQFRRFLVERYGPGAEGTPDAVGEARYRVWSRYWNGTDLELSDAYAYGWSEFNRLDRELHEEAERVLPGATPLEAMRHLDAHGAAIEGAEEMQAWLQGLIDGAIAALDGKQFDFDARLRRVEARIAPLGGASAAYYNSPSEDFSRPGTTWFPTLGRDRFPCWEQVSTWYHEGVPGHHLQLAHWLIEAPRLSKYQTTLGAVSANVEGWALYAERLMDELGLFRDAGERLGFLVGQQLRAVRVVIDIGMHLELEIPSDQSFHPGERWTPELGREFLLAHGGSDVAALESEVIRYLGMPGQAIGYKLGERAWLAGRGEARRRKGDGFDLKAWHMDALSLGSLGLDDLYDELAAL